MSEQAIRLTQYSHGAGCGCKFRKCWKLSCIASRRSLSTQTCLSATKPAMMPPFTISVMAPRSSAPPISLCRLSITRSTWPYRRHQRHQRYFRWAETDYGDCHPRLADHTGAGNRSRSGGGRALACQQADRAGGRPPIDAPEPIFGLAVTGVVPTERIKKQHRPCGLQRIY